MFDAAFVVNLDGSTARRERFYANVSAVDWPFPYPERWPGVDERPPRWWTISRGDWGCLRAHLSLYEYCILEGIEAPVIFEDDCLFPEDFGDRVRGFVDGVPNDWDQIYFGGNHRGVPVPFNDQCLRCTETNMTISCAIRGAARAAPLYFLARFFEQACEQEPHIDRIWATLHHAGRIRAYCPWDWITGQAAGVSDRSGHDWQEEWFHLPAETKRLLRERMTC